MVENEPALENVLLHAAVRPPWSGGRWGLERLHVAAEAKSAPWFLFCYQCLSSVVKNRLTDLPAGKSILGGTIWLPSVKAKFKCPVVSQIEMSVFALKAIFEVAVTGSNAAKVVSQKFKLPARHMALVPVTCLKMPHRPVFLDPH
jgi:hypothetical protein